MMTVINAKIYTMRGAVIECGYVMTENGKIVKVGSMTDYTPQGAEVDAEGRMLTPGLVDAHSHIGMWEEGLNFEGADGNEETDPCTPHLSAVDAVNPFDCAFEDARGGGVTCVVTGPGSANPIGGQIIAMKTYGTRVDDMIIKAPVGMKIAFGENPKSVYNDKNQTPVTRMATASIIRDALHKAREYSELIKKHKQNPDENDRPEYDARCEALLAVLNKKIPLHAHAHRADDIYTAVRIAEEFDAELILVHATEGHLISDSLAELDYPVLSGPILTDRSKPELKNQTEQSAAKLCTAGVKTAIITDHPEVPEKYLTLCAAIAHRNGFSYENALKAVTIIPAQICGIDDRVGSVAEGLDADMVIWDGDPLDFGTPLIVIQDGKITFSK